MAKPRNPVWDRDETILALHLYHEMAGEVPGATDARITELSDLLRANPNYAAEAREETFRNPAGVVFKLQSLRYVHTGEGYKDHSKRDREISEEFRDRQRQLSNAAAKIRKAIETGMALPTSAGELDFEFPEGKAITRLHIMRERDPRVRKKKLDAAIKRGKIACEACSLTVTDLADECAQSVFEVHHIDPLNRKGETRTTSRDVVILCANCHRLIHKLISLRQEGSLGRLQKEVERLGR